MIKLLIKLSVLFAVAVVAFLAVSVYSGGKPIRKAGDLVKRGAYQAARAADAIKGFAEGLTGDDAAEEAGERAREAKEDIEEKSGETKGAAESTFGKVKKGIKETFVWESDDGK